MIKTFPIFLPSGHVANITAGPTREMPPYCTLIRCAAEIPVDPAKVSFDVATGDYKPFDEEKLLEAVPSIIKALERDNTLYVGCMGGVGRTGTLLSILVAQHPGMTGRMAISYVRQIYNGHAVETSEQQEQVLRMAHITPINLIQEEAFGWDDEPGGPEMPMRIMARPWYEKVGLGWLHRALSKIYTG